MTHLATENKLISPLCWEIFLGEHTPATFKLIMCLVLALLRNAIG